MGKQTGKRRDVTKRRANLPKAKTSTKKKQAPAASAAKKTAALCGDIRKAFQIGRSAAEMVMKSAMSEVATKDDLVMRPIVRIGDVHKAGRASFNMVLVTAVSFSTPSPSVFL